MEAAAPFSDRERRTGERRTINVRRSGERRSGTYRSETLRRPSGKWNFALEMLVSVIAGVLGIGVLFLTGLFSGASSTIAQTILIFTIVFAYVAALRSALY